MDNLDFAVLGESLGVSGETGGVPAVVTGEFTLEVGHIGGEWAEELGTARAIPAGGWWCWGNGECGGGGCEGRG